MASRYAVFLNQVDKPAPKSSAGCPEMLAAGFEKARWGGYYGEFGGKTYNVIFNGDQAIVRNSTGMLTFKATFERGTSADEIRRIMNELAGRVPEVAR